MKVPDEERRRLAISAIRGTGAAAVIAAAAGALNGILVIAGLLALVGVTAFAWAEWIRRTPG